MTVQVFRQVSIGWQGKSFAFTPSNRLLRRIEGEGIVITALFAALQRGQPPISHLAYLLAACLAEAGAEVTEDDMLAALVGTGATEAMALTKQVLEAILPQVDGKKAEGSAAGPVTAPRAKKATRRR